MTLQTFLRIGPDRGRLPWVRAVLDAAPWVWPAEGPAEAEARRISAQPGPTPARAGLAPILVNACCEGAVFLCAADRPVPGLPPHAPHPSVRPEIAHLRSEVARHLPLRPGEAQPTFHAIDGARSAAACLPQLDGKSLGLSVSLALAGAALKRPLPINLAMSATVNEGGSLGRVSGWTEKATAIARLLPQVQRLLVAPRDVPYAQEALAAAGAQDRVTVIGLEDLRQALTVAFGTDALQQAVRDLPHPERSSLVRRFFRDALRGTSTLVHWGPVSEALEAALDWDAIPAEQRSRLEFARAVATRYARRDEPPPTPEIPRLDTHAEAVVLQMMAHRLQHHTRWGGKPPQEALDAVQRQRSGRTWEPGLKIRGAWARWTDAQGDHATALAEHRDVVHAWIRLVLEDQTSYSLTEWLRLAGALADREAFEEAVALSDQLQAGGAFGAAGSMYLRMGRAQGAWALSLSDPDPHRWRRLARADIDAVRAGAEDRPNWSRVERIALRYLAYLEPDDDEIRQRLRADEAAGTDQALVDLFEGVHDLRAWTDRLPGCHRWRARILIDQREDPLHLLRFFVDA